MLQIKSIKTRKGLIRSKTFSKKEYLPFFVCPLQGKQSCHTDETAVPSVLAQLDLIE